ncbi:MAG: SpoIID/LytB domain-containing protein, partial [Candidatus Omnitrophota bacterium]
MKILKKCKHWVLACGALAMFFMASSVWSKEPVFVRVAILNNVPEVTLSVSGFFEMTDLGSGKVLLEARNLASSKTTATARGIKIKNAEYPATALKIHSKKKAGITVNGRRYRGDVVLFKTGGQKLLVVNILDLEAYVKGVLNHEVSEKWPLAALKAQAVATRTYALYQCQVMKTKDYDVTADVSSQVYGGRNSEKRRTNRAVNFTWGEILTYQGKVFPTYFHATCGGMTEDAGELWKINIAPLKGGRVCSYCQESPHFYWKATLDLKTIAKKLQAVAASKGNLVNISVAERNARGRVRTLELKDGRGAKTLISAKEFRAALGPDVIRSTNFTIAFEGDRIIFNGKGWGHGAG